MEVRNGERVRGAQLSRGCRLSGAPPSLTPRRSALRLPPPLVRREERPLSTFRVGRFQSLVSRRVHRASVTPLRAISQPCGEVKLSNVKYISYTGVVRFGFDCTLYLLWFVLTKVLSLWKFGLHERIMALARWAILVVGVNTELDFILRSSKDLPGWVNVWFRIQVWFLNLYTFCTIWYLHNNSRLFTVISLNEFSSCIMVLSSFSFATMGESCFGPHALLTFLVV